MVLEYQDRSLGGVLRLRKEDTSRELSLEAADKHIYIIWNRSEEPQKFWLDGIAIELQTNQITTATYFHLLDLQKVSQALTIFSFNREFYCVNTHDEEVSCNGIIFFGAQELPIITLDSEDSQKLDYLLQLFEEEFQTKDRVQGAMLQMLLKQLIIRITRLAKEQLVTKALTESQVDTIRKFNTLVDMHYKEKKQVAEYAELLFKSPKTLSNLFAKYGEKSPLRIIHERIVLEAKRQLQYADKTVKEIAHDLGFQEVASFHKLFKKVAGCTPQAYKEWQQTLVNE